MAFHPQDLKSDAHRARHPLGRVPVLDDGDIRIFESGAIVEYVLARHKNGGSETDGDRCRIPRIFAVVSLLRGHGDATGEHHRGADGIAATGAPGRNSALAQAQRLLSKALEPVNAALEGREYVIGDFSAADIMLGHACFMSNRLGCVGEDMPHLKAYERIANRPAFKTAIEMQ